MGCGNQFKQFVRVVQQIGELVLILAERCYRQLRGHARVFQPRIGGHKADFIDADSLRPGQRGFQLQRQLRWFGLPGGKSVNKSANLFFCDRSEKLYAGQARRAEQLRELLFGWRPFQRHTIQQELRIRRSEQQSPVRPHGNSGAQFLPGDLQLFDRPGMLVAVQASKLQQNV